MAVVDLRQYVVAKNGTWFENPDNFAAEQLTLTAAADAVTLSGPLTVSITTQARNTFVLAGSSLQTESFNDIYSYNLSIPAGNLWSYPETGFSTSTAARAAVFSAFPRIQIRPAQTTPMKTVVTGEDVPCGYGVSTVRDVSQFFPSPCEGCPPGASVSMLPGGSSTLVGPADGGCIRPRYYNGMLVTREDLENEQRYFRLKNKMQNRAMGAGVVWGFSLSRTATGVCVQPGYGVDCCGNDIVVTEPYHVLFDALLRDPKALAYSLAPNAPVLRRAFEDDCGQSLPPASFPPGQDPCRRMHLLLEYVECPQDPRPVHGDICGSDSASCEMSRIRETARLRLVPPRDYDPSGPIDKFLAIYQDILSGKAGTGTVNPTTGLSTSPAVLPATAPFEVRINWTIPTPNSQSLAMPTNSSATAPTLGFGGRSVEYKIEIPMVAGFEMKAGQVVSDGATLDNAHTGVTAFTWTDSVVRTTPAGSGETVTRVYNLSNLQFASTADPNTVITGSAVVTVTINFTGNNEFETQQLSASNQLVAATTQATGKLPCLDESCSCGDGPPRFPVFPPFLHDDPAQPGSAVDWKVLVLAAAYAFFAMEQQRSQIGTPNATQTAQLAFARALYVALLVVLFGKGLTASDFLRLTKALLCLFRDWCKALLYPGPVCEGNPHGVVVGCATIRGGRIVDVDPWGGRRWVVHYPLLSYWGQQFGIVPLDVFASRLFGMICCIARLPLPTTSPDPQVGATINPAEGITSSQRIGGVTMVSAPSGGIAAALKQSNLRPSITRTLSLPQFAATFLEHLQNPAQDATAPIALYQLAGADTVAFTAPISQDTGGQQPNPGGVRVEPSAEVGNIVRQADPASRQSVPPLLRPTADALGVALLNEVTVADIGELPEGAAASLSTAGVITLGGLLSLDPPAASAALGSAATANRVLRTAENRATQVARIAYQVLATSEDLKINSLDDLQDKSASTRVATALKKALTAAKVSGAQKITDAALANAVRIG